MGFSGEGFWSRWVLIFATVVETETLKLWFECGVGNGEAKSENEYAGDVGNSKILMPAMWIFWSCDVVVWTGPLMNRLDPLSEVPASFSGTAGAIKRWQTNLFWIPSKDFLFRYNYMTYDKSVLWGWISGLEKKAEKIGSKWQKGLTRKETLTLSTSLQHHVKFHERVVTEVCAYI